MKQIHNRFSTSEVKELFTQYEDKATNRNYIQTTLGISKTRFFELIKKYRQNPQDFDITYKRISKSRISENVEYLIKEELIKENALIETYSIPIYRYNYSSVSRQLLKNGIEVSAPTIRNKAKQWGYYKERSNLNLRKDL